MNNSKRKRVVLNEDETPLPKKRGRGRPKKIIDHSVQLIHEPNVTPPPPTPNRISLFNLSSDVHQIKSLLLCLK